MKKHSNASHLGLALICSVTLAGCSGGDNGGGNGPVASTLSPLCSEVGGVSGKDLFPVAVVPADKVVESLIFGGMDPGGFEPINHELGFLLNDINVPVTAPGILDIRSIEYTNYLEGARAGETDYGFAFHVCSVEEDGVRQPAVAGNFAHMTGLAPAFQEILDSQEFNCETYETIDETAETCHLTIPLTESEGLLVQPGTLMGSAGGSGLTAYAPGFDFNLMDTRHPNQYVNPNRLGSETGAGRGFRYGACVYEYFEEPYKTSYLDKVGQGGDHRVHDDLPCGTLSVDLDGKAAGIWIREDMAALEMGGDDWITVVGNVLVLGPHPVFPGSREVISSYMTEVSGAEGLLIEFQQTNVGDVNLSVYDMTVGTTHCVSATGFGNPIEYHFLIEVEELGAKLKLERLDASCELTAEADRVFSPAAITFVR